MIVFIFFFQAEDGIRDVERSRGLGDVYKRQADYSGIPEWNKRKRLSAGWRTGAFRGILYYSRRRQCALTSGIYALLSPGLRSFQGPARSHP